MNIFSDILALNQPTIQQAYLFCLNQQFEQAKSLLDELIENQNADAMYLLALLYLEGVGIEKDIPLATHWFKQAIALNHTIKLFQHAARLEEPQSQLKLACLYLEGPAFESNIERAHAILNQFIVQYQKALLLIEPELLVKILAFNPSKSFKRNHQAFLDAQLKLQDIETEQSHQPR
jgi:TPR repeat protein